MALLSLILIPVQALRCGSDRLTGNFLTACLKTEQVSHRGLHLIVYLIKFPCPESDD